MYYTSKTLNNMNITTFAVYEFEALEAARLAASQDSGHLFPGIFEIHEGYPP